MSTIYSYGVAALNHATSELTRSAAGLARQSVDPKVDVAKETVGLDLAEAGANTAVALVRTGDELQKSLLDILA